MWEFVKSSGDTLIWATSLLMAAIGAAAILRKPFMQIAERARGSISNLEMIPKLASSMQNVERSVLVNAERQRAAMSASGMIALEMDARGLVQWASSRFTEITGFSSDRLRGYGWINTICDDCRESIREQWHDALVEEREFHGELVLSNHRGVDMSMNCHAQCLKSPDTGAVVAYAMTFTPVS